MAAVSEVVERVVSLTVDRTEPLVVAIDGRSGAGKSTLASAAAEALDAAIVSGDDFYSGGRAEDWDDMTPAERALYCIDWRRQRSVLRNLRRRRPASWFSFDWSAFDGRHATTRTTCRPSHVVILDGVYSARPELADLVDLTVLVEVPEPLRRQRLQHREGDTYRSAWEDRWSSAETHYFDTVMSPERFDLVVGAD